MAVIYVLVAISLVVVVNATLIVFLRRRLRTTEQIQKMHEQRFQRLERWARPS